MDALLQSWRDPKPEGPLKRVRFASRRFARVIELAAGLTSVSPWEEIVRSRVHEPTILDQTLSRHCLNAGRCSFMAWLLA